MQERLEYDYAESSLPFGELQSDSEKNPEKETKIQVVNLITPSNNLKKAGFKLDKPS